MKDRFVARLAEVFKDTDVMPMEEAVQLTGMIMPPGEAIRYYRRVVDGQRLRQVVITHRTKYGGAQSDDHRIYQGRRLRAKDCIRNQINHGRFVREKVDGVEVLRLTESGHIAVEHWLRGEVAPMKNKRPD